MQVVSLTKLVNELMTIRQTHPPIHNKSAHNHKLVEIMKITRVISAGNVDT